MNPPFVFGLAPPVDPGGALVWKSNVVAIVVRHGTNDEING
jgi:hypothetical protein